MRFEGKVALVTGAARDRGIGRGIALALAEEGCDVFVNDVAAQEEGEELAEQIRAGGRRALFHRADVCDRAQVDAMVETVVRELGRLDVVCSNAGAVFWEDVVDVQPEHFRTQVGVNLTGAFNVCQAGARALVRQGEGGQIVVTSSVHVQMPFTAMSIYGGTKQALRALVEHMAIELAPHRIRVNHIGPGWVRSAINDPSPALKTDEDVEATMRAVPLGRPADPMDLGRAVCYLASEDAAYVTGTFLRVDGGFVVGKY